MKTKLQLFQNQKVRTSWDEEAEEWLFSIVDVVRILTDQPTYRSATKYWNTLKTCLKQEGSELSTKCGQLKLQAEDGKIANSARKNIESQTGRSVISSQNAKELQRQITKNSKIISHNAR